MDNDINRKIKEPVKSSIAKVPVVMQMEALECGAACLAMVMAYYDKWVPLEQVREDCAVSRDGAKAGNIAKVARSYGFEATGIRYEPDDLKKNGYFPCIVHWEFNHFIVVKGFKGGKVYINDPASGDICITEKDFDAGFTGVCILINPGDSFVPSGNKKSMFGFAKRRLEGAGSAVTFVAVATALASVLALFAAGFSRFFMDDLMTGRNSDLVTPFMVALAVLTLVQIIIAWITAVYSLRIAGKFAAVGNTSYFWHVLNLPMRFFMQRFAGDIDLRRIANARIADILVNTFAPLIINSAMLVFYLAVMLSYSVWMTAVGLLSVVISTVISYFVSAKRVNITRVMLRDESKLYPATVAGIKMIDTIKSNGAETGYFRKWSGYQASVNTQRVRYARIDAGLGRIPAIVMELVNDVVLLMGVYLILEGEFTSGMVLAFQRLLMQFLMPVQSFITAGQVLQEMRSEMERIDDVMEYPIDPALVRDRNLVNETDTPAGKLSGLVELKHVSFGYSRLSPPLIEDFSMTLEPGKSVALVGGSGCGKSTLGRLISGLYRPWSGEILFDGKSMDEIDRDVFTGSLSVVDQDIILFEDTIANNIKMWDNSIEDFEMILAARDAQIHEDIIQRRGGYNYKLADGGLDLSGGQRQRIEIARVLAQDPTIIIMDEATSALDARTEYDVVSSIKNRGISCIVVAHRLSTIRECDEIIVLDGGKVVERGTHEELMALNGTYTKLVMSE